MIVEAACHMPERENHVCLFGVCLSFLGFALFSSRRQLAELLKERQEARDQHKREARRAKFQEMVSQASIVHIKGHDLRVVVFLYLRITIVPSVY